VDTLLGDASKARQKLGWEPQISFEELVAEMVAADLKEAEKDTYVRKKGYRIYGNAELTLCRRQPVFGFEQGKYSLNRRPTQTCADKKFLLRELATKHCARWRQIVFVFQPVCVRLRRSAVE
jgi:hypothetical protein